MAHALYGGLSFSFSSDEASQIGSRNETSVQSWHEKAALIPYHLSAFLTLVYGGTTFWRFSNGDIFTERSVQLFGRLAFWMLSTAFTGLFTGIFAFALKFGTGQTLTNDLVIDISGSDLITLGIGAMVGAFALILREAKRHVDDVRLIF